MGSTLNHTRRQASLSIGERGDTIVEVLISLIVIASIITGAFIVSRASTQNIRSSQEHTEALQILQGQVEMLRAYGQGNFAALSNHGSPFCMQQSDGSIQTGNACSISNSSNSYKYDIAINRDVDSDGAIAARTLGDTFRLTVAWDALNGTRSTESLVYRVPVTD
jgi:type II secretory pathway pseudopilin PulG